MARNGGILALTTFSKKKVNLLTNAFSCGEGPNYKGEAPLANYDQGKHYVDDFNRRLGLYYYHHRHTRWTQAFLHGLVKMAVTNAFLIHHSVVNNSLSYRQFWSSRLRTSLGVNNEIKFIDKPIKTLSIERVDEVS